MEESDSPSPEKSYFLTKKILAWVIQNMQQNEFVLLVTILGKS